MSDVQTLNSDSQNINGSQQDDIFSGYDTEMDTGDNTYAIQDSSLDDFGTDGFSTDKFKKDDDIQVSLDQIRDLEKKASALKKLGSDKDLLSLIQDLQTAEQDELQALHNEKFKDDAHQHKALELKTIAAQLYQKAAPILQQKQSTADSVEATKAVTQEQQKFSEKLGAKLANAANKVGYVHYDIKKERNGWAIAMSVLTIGLFTSDFVDINVDSTMDKPYTVGFTNVHLHEQAADMHGGGDQSNTSHGDHSHSTGDEIDQQKYIKLEEAQRKEATDVQAMLRGMGNALQETDPAQREEAWKTVLGSLDGWNEQNQDKATVYHRARLLFDALVGEGGDSDLKKALGEKLIPEEFSAKLSAMLESLPDDAPEKDLSKKENIYNRGGASDRNWANQKCSDFLQSAIDPNFISVKDSEDAQGEDETQGTDGEKGADAKPVTDDQNEKKTDGKK